MQARAPFLAGVTRQFFLFADDQTVGWRVDQKESTNFFDYRLTGERCACKICSRASQSIAIGCSLQVLSRLPV
jgi:hypothetical protein